MSPLFVTMMKDKCNNCKDKPVKGRKFCAEHLTHWRQKWRDWQNVRRKQALCCYCSRKSFKGWLRCRYHTMENRSRVIAWHLDHPGYSSQQWEKRKQLMKAGFCPMCSEHRRLPAGYKRCDECRQRRSANERKSS